MSMPWLSLDQNVGEKLECQERALGNGKGIWVSRGGRRATERAYYSRKQLE